MRVLLVCPGSSQPTSIRTQKHRIKGIAAASRAINRIQPDCNRPRQERVRMMLKSATEERLRNKLHFLRYLLLGEVMLRTFCCRPLFHFTPTFYVSGSYFFAAFIQCKPWFWTWFSLVRGCNEMHLSGPKFSRDGGLSRAISQNSYARPWRNSTKLNFS